MVNQRPVDNLPPHFGTTLDYIGSIIVTIGDAISTIGIGIEVAQDFAADEKSEQQDREVAKKFEDMQNQLNALQKELESLKKNGGGKLGGTTAS